METYLPPKTLVDNPLYLEQRRKTLAGLHDGMIDQPIVDLINAFNQLPECFTDSDAVSTTMIDQESDLFRVVENILANAVNEHPCK